MLKIATKRKQAAFTLSLSFVKTAYLIVNMFQVNSKETRTIYWKPIVYKGKNSALDTC